MLNIIGVYYVVINVGFEDDTQVKFFENFQTGQLRPHISTQQQQTELETQPRKKS